jgi:hypothetical protein
VSQYVAESSGNLTPDAVEGGRVKEFPYGNFMLMVHPLDWQMHVSGQLRPVIVQIGKEVGNGAVSRRGNANAHRLEHEQRGYVMIPHDLLGDDYVQVYRNEHGKKVHVTVFQVPVPGLDGTTWEFRAEAYEKFLKLLKLRGIVKAPQPQVVRKLLNDQRHLQSEELKRGPRAQTAEMVDKYERTMRKLTETIAYLEGELAASIRIYGDTRGEIDDRLDALLDAEVETETEAQDATRAVQAAVGRKPRKPRAPKAERPRSPVAEPPAGEDGEIDGDHVDEDDE